MAQIMNRPHAALMWMTLFLAIIGGVIYFVMEPLLRAFQANTLFNSLIVAVLLIGVLINYRQVLALFGEIRWIHEFRRKNPERPMDTSPRLLAPMARMLAQRDGGPLSLSALSLRSLLDSIRSRLDDSRDVSRYMIGLLIFLGLLGTFWGLLVTIGDIGQVISGLEVAEGDAVAVFDRLKAGLAGPLSGMGIAFSSSLFGLAGSLVLGFLDLQSGHAQNRFFNELEEWLSGATRLSSGALPGDGEAGVEPYVQALLEQTADGLERLQRQFQDQAGSSSQLHHQLATLNRRLADLGHHMENQSLSEDLRQELRLLNRTMAAALKGRETVD